MENPLIGVRMLLLNYWKKDNTSVFLKTSISKLHEFLKLVNKKSSK